MESDNHPPVPLFSPNIKKYPLAFPLLTLLLAATLPARAITLRVSAPALQRTLNRQVFTTLPPSPDLPTRRYLRGKPGNGCSVFSDTPQVSFDAERIVVRVHTHANFGASVHGHCFGVWLNLESQVSFIPQAEGESIGFHDVQIDRLTGSKEVDALLLPFLSKKMPAEMKLNAADALRTLFVRSPDSTGYTLTLTTLNIRSMQVDSQSLLLDLDADIQVN